MNLSPPPPSSSSFTNVNMITDATHFSVHSSFSTLAFIVFVNPKGEPQSEVSWFMRMNLCACIICVRRGLNDLLLPARVSLEESDLTFVSLLNSYITFTKISEGGEREREIRRFGIPPQTNKGCFHYLSGRAKASVQETVRKTFPSRGEQEDSLFCFSFFSWKEVFICFASSVNILNQTIFVVFRWKNFLFSARKLKYNSWILRRFFWARVEKRTGKSNLLGAWFVGGVTDWDGYVKRRISVIYTEKRVGFAKERTFSFSNVDDYGDLLLLLRKRTLAPSVWINSAN